MLIETHKRLQVSAFFLISTRQNNCANCRHALPLTKWQTDKQIDNTKRSKHLAECHCSRSQLKSFLPGSWSIQYLKSFLLKQYVPDAFPCTIQCFIFIRAESIVLSAIPDWFNTSKLGSVLLREGDLGRVGAACITCMPGGVTVGDSGPCCRVAVVRVTSMERYYFPFLADSLQQQTVDNIHLPYLPLLLPVTTTHS